MVCHFRDTHAYDLSLSNVTVTDLKLICSNLFVEHESLAQDIVRKPPKICPETLSS